MTWRPRTGLATEARDVERELGAFLREVRLARGLKLQEVAAATPIRLYTSLSKFELGDRGLSYGHAVPLIQFVCGVDIHEHILSGWKQRQIADAERELALAQTRLQRLRSGQSP